MSTQYPVASPPLQQYPQGGLAHTDTIRDQQSSPSLQQQHLISRQESLSPRSVPLLNGAFPQLDQSRPSELLSAEFPFFQNNFGAQDQSQIESFEALLVDPGLQIDQQSPGQSLNPAELAGHTSPPLQNTTNFSGIQNLRPDQPPRPQANASVDQLSFHSPHHSPRNALDPASAATLPQGSQPTDWTGMLQGPSFQGHRRTPSEISDVSSSAAPSPFLGNVEFVDSLEQQPSPLLRSQPDASVYQDGLGIEHFTISDPAQNHRMSPGPSPHVSPRLLPHNGADMGHGNNFTLSQVAVNGQLHGGLQSEIFPAVEQERVPSLQVNNGSGDLGFADQMATPEINIEYAAPSKQQHLEPPGPSDDGNALSPPERGMLDVWIDQGAMLTGALSQDVKGACELDRIRTRALRPWRDQALHVQSRLRVRSAPFPHTMSLPEELRLISRVDARPPLRFPTGTTSSTLRIRKGVVRTVRIRDECRSIRRPFNVISARSALPVRITFDRISVLTRMNARSSARCVAKRLLDSMTGNVMKACIPERSVSFVKANSNPAPRGVVDVVSRGPMH